MPQVMKANVKNAAGGRVSKDNILLIESYLESIGEDGAGMTFEIDGDQVTLHNAQGDEIEMTVDEIQDLASTPDDPEDLDTFVDEDGDEDSDEDSDDDSDDDSDGDDNDLDANRQRLLDLDIDQETVMQLSDDEVVDLLRRYGAVETEDEDTEGDTDSKEETPLERANRLAASKRVKGAKGAKSKAKGTKKKDSAAARKERERAERRAELHRKLGNIEARFEGQVEEMVEHEQELQHSYYRIGDTLMEYEDTGQELGKAGDQHFRRRGAARQAAVERVRTKLLSRGLDVKLDTPVPDRLIKNSRQLRAVGLNADATFQSEDIVGEDGSPITDDAGLMEYPINQIPYESFYAMNDLINADNVSRLLAFMLMAPSAKHCLSAKKAIRATAKNKEKVTNEDIFNFLDNLYGAAWLDSDQNERSIRYQKAPDSPIVKLHKDTFEMFIRELPGVNLAPEMRNISVSKEIYEGSFANIRQRMSVWYRRGGGKHLDKQGQINMNTFISMILAPYAEDIFDDAQIQKFLVKYVDEIDPDTDWEADTEAEQTLDSDDQDQDEAEEEEEVPYDVPY